MFTTFFYKSLFKSEDEAEYRKLFRMALENVDELLGLPSTLL